MKKVSGYAQKKEEQGRKKAEVAKQMIPRRKIKALHMKQSRRQGTLEISRN